MNPLRGTPGHPSHPPMTDAAIGMYTLAAALAIIGAIGWIEDAAGKGMWLALLGGLIAAAGAAVGSGLTVASAWKKAPPAAAGPFHSRCRGDFGGPLSAADFSFNRLRLADPGTRRAGSSVARNERRW